MLPSSVILCLPIGDRPRSHAFYTDGLGWTVAGRAVAGPGTVECQLSLTLADEGEVNAFVERERAAGAEVALEPGDQGWAYAGSFADPDGHLWLVVANPLGDGA